MPQRIYLSEEEYRTANLRNNETRKALSTVFVQLGTVLVAAGVAQVYADGYMRAIVGGWFLVAISLISIGVAFLRGLESES